MEMRDLGRFIRDMSSAVNVVLNSDGEASAIEFQTSDHSFVRIDNNSVNIDNRSFKLEKITKILVMPKHHKLDIDYYLDIVCGGDKIEILVNSGIGEYKDIYPIYDVLLRLSRSRGGLRH